MSPSQVDIRDLSEDDEAPKSKASSSSKRPSNARSDKSENELRGKLEDTFGRISLALDARGDEELAGIIDEDASVMAQGLVTLTKPFKPVRAVVVAFVSVVEPLLAFRRILLVLGRRFAERRMRAQEAQSQPDTVDSDAYEWPAGYEAPQAPGNVDDVTG